MMNGYLEFKTELCGKLKLIIIDGDADIRMQAEDKQPNTSREGIVLGVSRGLQDTPASRSEKAL